jgi:hypothetical protein
MGRDQSRRSSTSTSKPFLILSPVDYPSHYLVRGPTGTSATDDDLEFGQDFSLRSLWIGREYIHQACLDSSLDKNDDVIAWTIKITKAMPRHEREQHACEVVKEPPLP